jgi:hypothetical protein
MVDRLHAALLGLVRYHRTQPVPLEPLYRLAAALGGRRADVVAALDLAVKAGAATLATDGKSVFAGPDAGPLGPDDDAALTWTHDAVLKETAASLLAAGLTDAMRRHRE